MLLTFLSLGGPRLSYHNEKIFRGSPLFIWIRHVSVQILLFEINL